MCDPPSRRGTAAVIRACAAVDRYGTLTARTGVDDGWGHNKALHHISEGRSPLAALPGFGINLARNILRDRTGLHRATPRSPGAQARSFPTSVSRRNAPGRWN